MAFSAAAIKGATVAAIFMVVVVLSSMGMLAAAETSCRQRHCISQCPSKCQEKADSSCADLKHGGSNKCPIYCSMYCKSDCEDNCKNAGPRCPAGGVEECDLVCGNRCREHCYNQENPNYRYCLSAVFQGCKDECETECKSGKV